MKIKNMLAPLVCVAVMGTACSKKDDNNDAIRVDTSSIQQLDQSSEATAESLALADRKSVV